MHSIALGWKGRKAQGWTCLAFENGKDTRLSRDQAKVFDLGRSIFGCGLPPHADRIVSMDYLIKRYHIRARCLVKEADNRAAVGLQISNLWTRVGRYGRFTTRPSKGLRILERSRGLRRKLKVSSLKAGLGGGPGWKEGRKGKRGLIGAHSSFSETHWTSIVVSVLKFCWFFKVGTRFNYYCNRGTSAKIQTGLHQSLESTYSPRIARRGRSSDIISLIFSITPSEFQRTKLSEIIRLSEKV